MHIQLREFDGSSPSALRLAISTHGYLAMLRLRAGETDPLHDCETECLNREDAGGGFSYQS
jgi:hypothetical protein